VTKSVAGPMKGTKKMQMIFVIALSAIFLTGCVKPTTMQGGATETELCRQWGGSLPSRSRLDTDQTKKEIQDGYGTFVLACPKFDHLVP